MPKRAEANGRTKTSPTQRSLKKLRRQGWRPAVVEKWIPATKRRSDLFGFVDIIAVRGNQTLAVQTTTKTNMASRRAKIIESVNFPALLAAGWEIEIHGWYKNAHNVWLCKVQQLGAENLWLATA